MSAIIACIGSESIADVIIFTVGDSTMRLLRNFTRTNSVRFAENDILGKKPCRQYVGPATDSISLKISLRSWWGCKPRKELDKLIYLQRDGAVLTFLVGGAGFGRYKWTIESLKEEFEHIDNEGNIHSVDCTLTLKEYVPRGY